MVLPFGPSTSVDPNMPGAPPEEGPHKVRCWSPDSSAYHETPYGTVIPRSKGSTLTSQTGAMTGVKLGGGVFSVYETGDDGVQRLLAANIDPHRVTQAAASAAFATAAAITDDPELRTVEAYRALGASCDTQPTTNGSDMSAFPVVPVPPRAQQQTSSPAPAAAMPATIQPTQSAAPPVAAVAAHVVPPAAVPPQPAVTAPTQPQYQPAAAPQLPVVDNYAAANQQLLSAILQGQQQMLQALTQLHQPTAMPQPQPQPVPTVKAEEPAATAPTGAAQPEPMVPESKVEKAVDKSWELLRIPGLALQPGRPEHRVQFDMGDAGTIIANYHWVGIHGQGLFLIFDTRFEYGTMYAPPDLGGDRTVKVTLLNHGRTFVCHSANFVHPFGVFYIVNLVIADEQPGRTLSDDDGNELEDSGPLRKAHSLSQLLGAD